MASFVKILGYSKDSKNFNNIACDAGGNLSVSGLKFNQDGELLVTSTGGGGGTASAELQQDQIDIATASNLSIYQQLADQTDRILFDTDIIANNLTNGNLAVCTRLDNLIFTSGNLHVRDDATLLQLEGSNLAQYGKLDLIEQGTEINAGFLQTIDFKLTPLQQGVATYTIDAVGTLSAGTVPAYKAPPAGIMPSDGWYYKNTSAGNASQLYYYGNNATQTQNHDYTLSSIESQWAVVRYLALNSSAATAYLVVYSQPQGTGDFIPGFARSRLIYQIATGQDLRLGEKVVIYRGTEPDLRIFPELRRVQCSLTISNGPCLSSELLAYATLNSASDSAVGDAEYIVGGAGLSFAGDHVYKVELTGESSVVSAGDASSANQVSSNTAVCARLDNANTTISNSNLALASRLTTLSSNIGQMYYTASNLLVSDAGSLAELITIRDILGDSVATKLFAQSDTDPETIIPILGNSGNLFVYDADVKSELVTLNSTYDSLIDGTSSLYVRLDGTDDAVQIWGYNPVLDMPEGIQTVDNAVKAYITNSCVTVSGTVGLSEGAQVNLVNSTVGLETGTSVAITGDVAVTGTFWPETQVISGSIGLIENTVVGIAGSSVIGITGDVSIINSTGTSLDVHCFASSNGTDYHHVKSTATGELVVHSQVFNSSGTAITTTPNGGITALDVAISGTPVISGEVSTKAQVAYAPQVLASGTVVGPAQIGTTADSQGFLWVAALLTFTSVTTGGQLYIEISPDGSNWARPSAGSVFVMSSVSNVTASILLGVPVAMRYVRLYADSPFSGSGCNAFFSMK